MPTAGLATGAGSARRRLAGLKLRVLLVAGAALGALVAGAWVAAAPLRRGLLWLYASSSGDGAAMSFDLPEGLTLAAEHDRLQLVFLVLVAIAAIGFSAGAVPRKRALPMAVLPLLFAGFAWLQIPPCSRWMLLAPSQLERSVARGDWDAARLAVAGCRLPVGAADYLLAQVALREGDAEALRWHATPVLAVLDRFVYRVRLDPVQLARLQLAVDFQPEVVWALDVALHGQPQTEIGIRWETEYRQAGAASAHQGLRVGVAAAGGAALLVLALLLSRVWNGMRLRVERIQQELGGAADANGGAWMGSRLPLVVGGGAFAALAAGWILAGAAQPETGATVTADADPSSRWPCRFVGTWIASGPRTAHKVSLTEGGVFIAERVGAAAPARALRGSWTVSGLDFHWGHDGSPVAWPYDSRLVQADKSSFALREGFAEPMRFHLVQGATGGRCGR